MATGPDKKTVLSERPHGMGETKGKPPRKAKSHKTTAGGRRKARQGKTIIPADETVAAEKAKKSAPLSAEKADKIKIPAPPVKAARKKMSAKGDTAAERKRIARKTSFKAREGLRTRRPHEIDVPPEYDENELFLMVVDPDVVYASWGIRASDRRKGIQGLTLRIRDVTGEERRERKRGQIDIQVDGPAGSGFFSVAMHGREIVAELGSIAGRKFSPLVTSNRVSVPPLMSRDETASPESPGGFPTVGYS